MASDIPTPDQAMRRIDALLAHVWMVRAFLKHSDDAIEDEEAQEVQRTLYDFHLAVGAAWKEQNAAEYLKLARKKYAKLRQASEDFTRIQPELSSHTNYQMAVASLATAVGEIGEILDEQQAGSAAPATEDFSDELLP
jgi:hypothetical protein